MKEVNKKMFIDAWLDGIHLPIIKEFTVSEKEVSNFLNMDFEKGVLVGRKGWKTFKGMVRELDKLNKTYKKNKLTGDFTIRLPIKGSL